MYDPSATSQDRASRHSAAVKRSLRWAQESADRGDYADALGWIKVLETIGERVPPSYLAKSRVWNDELAGYRAGPSRL